MNSNLLIAIVPGLDGGVAVNVGGVFDCRRLPVKETDLATLLRRLRKPGVHSGHRPVCLVAESDPVLLPEAARLGALRGMVLALDFEVVPVRPDAWQACVSPGHPSWMGLNPLQLKLRLQMAARLLFPQLDITPGTATALALLLWGMQRDHARPAVVVTAD